MRFTNLACRRLLYVCIITRQVGRNIVLRSDRERMRDSYPYQHHNVKSKAADNREKHTGASLGFCWGFGFVVCLTFGLASFLMFSAGHFDISPSTGAGAAWGGSEGEENFTSTRSLVQVEVTELEAPDELSDSAAFYAEAKNNMMEEFGPFPKYLSDYESITLSVHEDGTKLPVNEDDDEELIEIKSPSMIAEEPELTEQGPAWHEHVVKNGETLSDIALMYGEITAQDILRANGLKDANRLSENQLLLIPNDTSKVEDTLDEVRTRQMRLAATKEKLEPIRTKSYVVAQGDSLWSIANSQNVELDTLIGSNTFKTSARLKPGATLRIPNQEGIFYVMKNGETIEAVSKRYGVSMNKIRQVNAEKDTASLKTGDEIFLPGARPEGLVEHKDVKIAEVKKSAPAKTAAKTPALRAAAPKAEKPSGSEIAVRKAKGGFRWPIMGRINSPFGWRQHPITKRKDFHTGIDIKANRNDPIKAAGSGKVLYSGWMGGYGKVLVIEHPNGQSTLYAHCSTLLAGKGASVSSGQLVAKIGTTGRSTGPHLHFEVRNGNSPVNPIKYLSR